MKKNIKYIFIFLMCNLIAVFFLYIKNVEAGSFRITPNSGDLVKGCVYPFQIHMNTESESVFSTDTKIFLDGFEFSIFDNSDMDHNLLLTGMATDSSVSGKEYFYINSYQNPGNNISGLDINIGNFYFTVETGLQNTGSLHFYFISSGDNSDDSNIVKGLNNSSTNQPTQYKDILINVLNGDYNFLKEGTCGPVSTIISGYYYQNTFEDSGFDISEINTKIIAGYSFDYPNLYNGDDSFNSRTNNTGRTIWTNTAVNLIITGDYPFKIEESSISGYPISIVDNSTYTISKTLKIAGNVHNLNLVRNTSGNTNNEFSYISGSSIDTGIFNIDVFWIDTQITDLTGIIEYYTGSFANLILSGYTSGTSWSSIDDQFKIIDFSGNISAPTNYLDNSNNIFKLIHKLDFSGAWSGDVIYIDRAGNTGKFFVNIPPLNDYLVKAHPQGRLVTSHTPNPNLATIGEVAIYDSGYLLIATGTVKTNNYGTGFLSLEDELSGYYFVTFNGLAHLQSVISGTILLNNTHRIIDFTSGALTRQNGPIDDDIINFTTNYLNISTNNFLDLNFYELFNGFNFDDGLQFISSDSGTLINSGVKRTNNILPIGQNITTEFIASIKNSSITGFNLNPEISIFSGLENITDSGYLQITTGQQITSVEIAGELVKDSTINAVDASVIIDYILKHGPTNNNNLFGYVAEDLNANGQVDTADITIRGYNLMRWGTSFP